MSVDRFVMSDINFYAAFFLLAILATIYAKKDVYSYSSKMFKFIIITNVILLIFEGATFVYNGVNTEFAWYMNHIFNGIVFLITPLVGSFWASYIDHKIFNSKDRIKKRLYYLHPFYIGVVLSIINLFYPVLYSISEDNVYSREALISVNIATLYILLFYIFYLVIKNRKLLEKNVFYGVIMFMVFPAIGGALQMLFYGVSLLYSMMALGVVVTYIFLETVGSSKDYLTNLYTRVKSDEFIKNLMDRKSEFYIIMIDLENFKKLNDKYGHSEGDNVLKCFGIVLENVFADNALVSRFGGDEFLITVQINKEEKIFEYKQSIRDELLKDEYHNKLLRELRFSYGYSSYRLGDTKTIDQLIVEADDYMYIDKALNKNYKRRKSDR